MKKVSLIFILIIKSYVAFSQTDSTDIYIYRELLFKESLNDTFVYFDSTRGWDKIKEIIFSREIKESSNNPNSKTLSLSDEEIEKMITQVSKFEHHIVDLQKYLNCIEIPWDSLGKYHLSNQKLKQKQIKEALDRKDIEKIKALQEFKWIYGFSKPIYFRDKYCIVYRMAILNDTFAGNQSVFIMEDNGGNWKKWATISFGDW